METSFKIKGILKEETMGYTVKEVATLSGVTVKALHLYDTLGILKPAYYGENGYRYYEEKELILLQQILFYKELGVTLKEIQKLLRKKGYDPLKILEAHREGIEQERSRLDLLLCTLEKTIQHLKGNTPMQKEEFFTGLTVVKANAANEDEAQVLSSLRKVNEKPDLVYMDELRLEANTIYEKVLQLMRAKKGIDSREVQQLIQQHYDLINRLHFATAKVYVAYAHLYESHPAFKEQLDAIDPKLAPFMAKAMIYFADKKR
ncbi:MAG: MerR family transcriptional regulator [Chlamydiia bacterium]